MHLTLAQYLLGIASGLFVGFTLGVVGGGGSILAVPLIVYLVRVPDPHLAIGTTAVAVAANAAINLWAHARKGMVKWRCASVFAVSGVAGAFAGSTLGKALDGQKLLFLFAFLMVAVAILMLRHRGGEGDASVHLSAENAPNLVGTGLLAGGLSGFFGIGGGFLIVPSLMLATGMPIINAVGSSLLGVAAFGTTTALNYAASGWVDWRLATVFITGGIAGGFGGTKLAHQLAGRRGLLNTVVVSHGAAVHGLPLSIEQIDLARVALRRLGLVGKSNERDRRPTEDELTKLIDYFEGRKLKSFPMGAIIKFAVATAMRQDEIFRVNWGDLDRTKKLLTIRDRKDPREKKGNDQSIPLLDVSGYSSWDLVEEFGTSGKQADRIFPYNPKSVGTAFTRACQALKIEDLHFHDLRHEATSRLFEAGFSIEQVALVTGHKDWKMLRRYTHLKPERLHALLAAKAA